MLAIAAAITFAFALLLDLLDAHVGDWDSAGTLLFVGLLLIALHLAGVGAGWRTRRDRV